MRTHGAERSPTHEREGNGQGIKGPGKRDEGGREAGDSKTDHRSRERKRGTAAGASTAGWARRATGSSTRLGERANTERTRRRMAGRRRLGNIRIGEQGSPRRSRSSRRSKRTQGGNSNSQESTRSWS